jgi:phosphoribosylformimino-5-aminoimidazole carboxamide ribotide isomerase
MLIIPAIDLRGGRCVRLVEGREQSAKVYDRDPVEVARGYKKEGARLIHIVDLDGAFLGAASENLKIVRQIVEQTALPVEVGGGVRSLSDIESLLCDIGARYAILGTLAVEQPDLVAQAVARFGDRIVIGIDARGSRVATRGWTETTEEDLLSLARRMTDMGVERLIYTDISRDGRLEGPNFEMTREVALSSRARVTASGGVSSLEDIKRLSELETDGVDSMIVGKALYEGRFTLKEAIKACYGLDLDKLNACEEDHPLP